MLAERGAFFFAACFLGVGNAAVLTTAGARQTQMGHERLGCSWHAGSFFSLFVFTVERQVDLVTLLALVSILHKISLAREKLAPDLV